jgi:hypothetical protein
MRGLPAIGLLAAICAAGCRLPCQDAETGFEFKISKPPLVFARSPALIHREDGSISALPLSIQGRELISPDRVRVPAPNGNGMSPPMPYGEPPPVPLCPTGAIIPTRLTLDEWMRVEEYVRTRKPPKCP